MTKKDFEGRTNTGIALAFTIADANGAPVNLTGAAVRFRLASMTSTVSLIEKTQAAGITIPVPANGQISVAISDTDVPDSGLYNYAVDVTPSGGQVTRYFEGRFVMRAGPAAVAA